MPSAVDRLPEPPLNVLIVDDDPAARAALDAAVRLLGYASRSARSPLEALHMHRDERAEVILSDWEMPEMDGLALCRSVREEEGPYTYFILVTAHGDRGHFLEGMHAGADDYIKKPVDLEELEVRLETARRVIRAQRQLEAKNRVLRRDSERFFRAARRDPLTSIANRLQLKEDLEALRSRAARYGHVYSAALCDIDRFKAYNDHFGHGAGDVVLRKIVRAMRGELRRGDGFYRYGGEEFLVVLPEQPLAEAAQGMERVRKAVEDLRIPHAPAAEAPFVTISIGIAEVNADSPGGIDQWLERADRALYEAKARGRNEVVAEPMPDRAAGPAARVTSSGMKARVRDAT